MRPPLRRVSQGKLETGLQVDRLWKDRSLTGVGAGLSGFPEAELEAVPSVELQGVKSIEISEVDGALSSGTKLDLEDRTFHIDPV